MCSETSIYPSLALMTLSSGTVFHTKTVENWFVDILLHFSKTNCPMDMLHVPSWSPTFPESTESYDFFSCDFHVTQHGCTYHCVPDNVRLRFSTTAESQGLTAILPSCDVFLELHLYVNDVKQRYSSYASHTTAQLQQSVVLIHQSFTIFRWHHNSPIVNYNVNGRSTKWQSKQALVCWRAALLAMHIGRDAR